MPLEFELAPGRLIGGDHPCFIIAEIGQNHQGDVSIAKKMIKLAKVRCSFNVEYTFMKTFGYVGMYSQIRLLNGIKSEAAIRLSFFVHCKSIAILFIIPYCRPI